MNNFDSKMYWETRYIKNKNSGPGSYGRLAKFKAEIINNFVTKHNIQNIIEFGCGDGNQLSYYKFKNYTGIDVSKTALDICKEKFENDSSKKFIELDNYNGQKADLSMSIDVIFHLVEDEIFHIYMQNLFYSSNRYVIIYSSNNANLNSKGAKHVKHRCFTDWIRTNKANWNMLDKIENKYTTSLPNTTNKSFSDFFIFEKIQ